MKMFIMSMLGILLTVGGVYTMYVYIIGLDTRANVILLIVSILVICAGVFILVIAGKSDTIILKRVSKPDLDKNPIITPPTPGTETPGNLANKLEENNNLLKDWKKTNETKERLRMLEMQAQAEE
jgi:hypothetical protein